MLALIFQSLAGLCAAVGLVALISGPMSKSPPYRKAALRVLQVTMTFAGLALIVSCFLGKGWDQAAYGLMLIVFGTGVTAFATVNADGARKTKD